MSEHALDRMELLLRLDYFPQLTRDDMLEVLAETPIRLSADVASLRSRAGQTALITSAWVLSAMGLPPTLDIAEAEVLGPQPPLPRGNLAPELRRLRWTATHEDAALTIALGPAPVHGRWVRIGGGPMSATIATHVTPGEATHRLAGFSRACSLAPRHCGLCSSAWRRGAARPASRAPRSLRGQVVLPPLPRVALDVGGVDIISGGAITSATIFTLLRCTHAAGELRVFDDDRAESTNRNRYPFVTAADAAASVPKVALLERLSTPAITITGRTEQFTAGAAQLPLAPRILVGVDDIPARWVTQKHAPGWVHVGATSHFEVMSTSHPPGAACAGCAHPRDEQNDGPIPTISFVSLLAGIQQAWSLLAHAAGVEIPCWFSWPLYLTSQDGMARVGVARNRRCPVCSGAATA